MLAEVDNLTENQLLDITRFQKGRLPFRDFGVHVKPQRTNRVNCQLFIERMITARINQRSTKKLPYVRKVQLIDIVLLNLFSYWDRMFLLLKGALQEVNQICIIFTSRSDGYTALT